MQSPTASESSLVVFQCDGLWLAVAAERVEAFHDLTEPIPLPGAPAHVSGLVNLGGDVLPLFDLGRWLGLEGRAAPREAGHGRLMVVSSGRLRAAMPCSRVGGVLSVSSADLETPEAVQGERLKQFVDAVVPQDDRLVTVLDLEGVLEAARVRG